MQQNCSDEYHDVLIMVHTVLLDQSKAHNAVIPTIHCWLNNQRLGDTSCGLNQLLQKCVLALKLLCVSAIVNSIKIEYTERYLRVPFLLRIPIASANV